MSGSKLLEQAIVDAQALRDSAYKNAQATLIEKFAPQIKEAVERLLEQEPAEMVGSPEDALAGEIAPGTDFGGAPPDASDKGYVAGTAKDIPLAATDGEKVCPCPDDDEDVTLELNLADLADQLMIGRDAEEETDLNQQPMLGGMQNQPPAMGGAAQLQEELELESIELDEILLENDDEEEEDDEEDEEEDDEEEDEEDEEEESDEDEDSDEEDEEETLDEAKKAKKKLTPSQKKLAAMREPKDKVTFGDVVAARIASGKKKKIKKKTKKKVNESSVVQLMSNSAQLLKEHQNTIKLVEKKDSQIQKLLEENKKFSSTIEEMSNAFKKLEEVNLLNARLFYQNQVLKSASLNERQKTHIVEAISTADSVNEAKAVYETLINSVGGPAEKERSPKSLNEAISRQKSSFRLPHKQAEQPHDPNKDRWLKLAGIK